MRPVKEVVRLALGLETKEDDRFHSEKASACLDALGLRVFGLTPFTDGGALIRHDRETHEEGHRATPRAGRLTESGAWRGGAEPAKAAARSGWPR
ncbi:hypothetical protein F4556_006558 [Kitasatospora gansuensis]|uniref:Uncharacterized protein n=1 Tax=Kitasatospora gansuensis TaxID=258050 RepID=A0A7W7SJG3_9ACTN|nr:hypothetical protein [Kitasatospora gansuensis]